MIVTDCVAARDLQVGQYIGRLERVAQVHIMSDKVFVKTTHKGTRSPSIREFTTHQPVKIWR